MVIQAGMQLRQWFYRVVLPRKQYQMSKVVPARKSLAHQAQCRFNLRIGCPGNPYPIRDEDHVFGNGLSQKRSDVRLRVEMDEDPCMMIERAAQPPQMDRIGVRKNEESNIFHLVNLGCKGRIDHQAIKLNYLHESRAVDGV